MEAEIQRVLQHLETAAHTLGRTPVANGSDAADVTGRVRKVETDLAAYRRSLLSEETDAQGEHYAIVTEYPIDRSYGTAAIISSALKVGYGVPHLVREGIVKLSWTWSKLEAFFVTHDLELRVVGHEIADEGDAEGPHVGAVRKPYTRVIARERKE